MEEEAREMSRLAAKAADMSSRAAVAAQRSRRTAEAAGRSRHTAAAWEQFLAGRRGLLQEYICDSP